MSFSVLLSVFFKEKPGYLEQALFSIWDLQTLKPDQIVLVKDGALTPALEAAIQRWQEKLGEVLTLVELPSNIGLGAALNEGLKACRYELVARMDTDDVSLPERFEKQVAFMLQNPGVAASSAILEEWDATLAVKQGVRRLPTRPDEVLVFAKRRSPLSHPLAIFRKNIVLELGGYPPLRKAQDYALWSLLLSRGYELANLPDVLLKMRTGNEMLNRRGWGYFKQEYQLLKYQREIGFLSVPNFIVNTMIKGGLRLAPDFVKRWAYKVAR